MSPRASLSPTRAQSRAGQRTVALEHLFHALADPTRLGMVERLSRGSASVKELAEPIAMALPSVMKHLKVMERGGLVRSKKTGRVRVYQLRPPALSAIDGWLAERRAALNEQFDRLDQLLAEESNES